jgi:regulator of replication initiation timing
MSLIDKIKMLFEAEKTESAKFLDAKLVDGTIIRTDADAFKVGDKVQVMTEAGELVDAPVGEHELEDGTVLVVDDKSILTEVRTVEVKDEETAEAPVEMADEPIVELPEDEKSEDDRVAKLEDRVTALEEALVMLIDKLSGQMVDMSTVKAENAKFKAENEKLSKAPAAKPVSTKRFEKADEGKVNTKLTSTERIAQLFAANPDVKK